MGHILSTRMREVQAGKGSSVNRTLVDRDYLSLSERSRLAVRFHKGDTSVADRLVRSSLGQVRSVAERFSERGIPFDDLAQEACLALISSAAKYRGNRTSPFSVTAINNMKSHIKAVTKRHKRSSMALEFVPDTDNITSSASFRARTGFDCFASVLGNSIPSPLARMIVENMLAHLTTREARVLRLVFGLEDGSQHTIYEIGDILGVSGQCISNIRAKAMRRLRHPANRTPLLGELSLCSAFFSFHQAASFVDPRPFPKAISAQGPSATKKPVRIDRRPMKIAMLKRFNEMLSVFSDKEKAIIKARLGKQLRILDPFLYYAPPYRPNWNRKTVAKGYRVTEGEVEALEKRFLDRIEDLKLREKIERHFRVNWVSPSF